MGSDPAWLEMFAVCDGVLIFKGEKERPTCLNFPLKMLIRMAVSSH